MHVVLAGEDLWKTESEKRPLQLNLIVKESMKLLRASIPTTIKIQTKIESQNEKIFADATQMHQVIMNLCTNAAYAMREDGGELTVVIKEILETDEDVSLLASVHGLIHSHRHVLACLCFLISRAFIPPCNLPVRCWRSVTLGPVASAN